MVTPEGFVKLDGGMLANSRMPDSLDGCDKMWFLYHIRFADMSLRRKFPHQGVRQFVARQYDAFPHRSMVFSIRPGFSN